MRIFAERSACTYNVRTTNLAFHDLTPPEITLPPGISNLFGLNHKFCPSPTKLQKSEYNFAAYELIRTIRIAAVFNDADSTYNKALFVSNFSYEPPKLGKDANFENL